MSTVHFRILGPLEVSDGTRLLALGGPRQRAVLVALLLSANRVMAVDRLVDELWGEDPPAQALNALQTYVSKLRGVLEPDRRPREPARVLRSQPPGYVLVVNPTDLDAALFEELCGEGRALLQHGRPDAARERFAAALGLWRGPPLAEFADQPFARAEAARLEELRSVALEDRVAAQLALGEHSAVIAELQGSVADQPLRERLWQQLMLALYRAGRQGEALAAFQRCRAILDEQLGVEPGPALRRLQAQVLAHDPALDWSLAPEVPRRLRLQRPRARRCAARRSSAASASSPRSARSCAATRSGCSRSPARAASARRASRSRRAPRCARRSPTASSSSHSRRSRIPRTCSRRSARRSASSGVCRRSRARSRARRCS